MESGYEDKIRDLTDGYRTVVEELKVKNEVSFNLSWLHKNMFVWKPIFFWS